MRLRETVGKSLELIHAAERLKYTLRHGWASNGRQESVAEHSWRLSFMVILCHPYLKTEIDLGKCLYLAVIHDLCEIITGDIPFFEALPGSAEKNAKHIKEDEAMHNICNALDSEVGEHMYSLWKEYQEGESEEAKFICALDKVEAQIQQNEAAVSTWNEFEKKSIFNYLDEFCDHNDFLKSLKEEVRKESIAKLNSSIEHTAALPLAHAGVS